MYEDDDTPFLRWLEFQSAADRASSLVDGLNATLASITAFSTATNPVSKVLAVASGLSSVASLFKPQMDVEERLRDQGWSHVYHTHWCEIADAFHVLLSSIVPGDTTIVDGSKVTIWCNDKGKPCVVYLQDTADNGWLLEKNVGDYRKLVEPMWLMSPTWELPKTKGNPSDKFSIQPLKSKAVAPVGDVFNDFRDWAKKPAPPGDSLTALVIGPTGAGKTTLARTALGGSQRTLKVSGPIGSSGVAVIEVLKPDCVLVDDIVISNSTLDSDVSGVLDTLTGMVDRIVLTLMDDDITEESSMNPGGLYWPGMRAGRIDFVAYIPAPNEKGRREILTLYNSRYIDKLVPLTEGLTGAYLKQISELSHKNTWEGMERVLKRTRATAPKSFTRTEETTDGS